MNFDADDILIADALSDMENALDVPDLLPGVRAKLPERRRRLRLYVIAALIAAALLITGCAALGAFDWLISALDGGGFTDVVEPVEQSVTVEGVKFTVIAAERYGDTALVYFSLQDAEGRGRITEDSSPLLRAADARTGGVDMVYFDGETGTAVYTITLRLDPEKDYETLHLSLVRISNFSLSDRIDMEQTELDIDLASAVASGPETDEETLPVTLGRELPGTGGILLGSVGLTDGRPTVQLVLRVGGEYRWFWNLNAYIIDSRGDTYTGEQTSFALDENLEYDPPYTEPYSLKYIVYQYAFDVDPTDLEGAKLCIEGSYHNEMLGSWELDIDLAYERIEREYVVDIDLGESVIEDVKIKLSPVALTISGFAEREIYDEFSDYRLGVYTEDGERVRIPSIRTEYMSEDGAFNEICLFSRTVMPDTVEKIVFSARPTGEEIYTLYLD